MAKYVCDAEAVKSAVQELMAAAEEVLSKVTSYASTIETDLSSWTDALAGARTAYNGTNQKLIELSKSRVETMNLVANFIKKAVESIEKLESELSKPNI